MSPAAALALDGPALALTIGVEAAVVAALSLPLRLRLLRAVLASVVINLITQPTLWTVMMTGPFATSGRWWLALWTGEAIVWLVEAGLYLVLLAELRAQRGSIPKALALSLAANTASAALGLALGV